MDADCGFEGRLKNVRDGFAGSRLRDSAGGEHIGSGVSLIDFIPGKRASKTGKILLAWLGARVP